MDRLDAMQVLLAVVDEGSLSAAGRKLHAPLASVSRKVAELERHLGARLLIRTSRKVLLTDAGRDYVESARRIVADLQDAELRASGEYDQACGELTVTVPGGSSRGPTVALVVEFLGQHPKISINLISEERNVDLVDEQVDVGLRLGDLPDSSLYAVKCGEAALLTVASPDYLERRGRPTHPEHLALHDGILFGPLSSSWTYLVDGKPFEIWPPFRMSANRANLVIEAAVRGVGVARIGRTGVEKELSCGALVTVLDEYECSSVPVHLVYLKQGLMPLKVRSFLDWMAPRLRSKLKDGTKELTN